VAGHSAGAVACLVLTTMPRAGGLFRRAVAMSGTPWNLVDVASARSLGAELAGRAGVPPTVAGVGAVPVDELTAHQHALAPVAGIGPVGDPLDLVEHLATLRMWLGPVVDGDLVTEHPYAALATAGTGLPIVLGSAVGEVDPLIAHLDGGLTAADADRALARLGLAGPALAAWRAAHPDRPPAVELGAALTALSFRIPALAVAEARAGAAAPTFVYETTWCAPTALGTFHGLDVPFAWDTIDADEVATICGGPPPRSLADDMAGALVRFARDGAPGWPAYDLDTRTEMAFDVPSHLRRDPDRAARTLFGPLR
jgi:para-nitrobenzyl esterase